MNQVLTSYMVLLQYSYVVGEIKLVYSMQIFCSSFRPGVFVVWADMLLDLVTLNPFNEQEFPTSEAHFSTWYNELKCTDATPGNGSLIVCTPMPRCKQLSPCYSGPSCFKSSGKSNSKPANSVFKQTQYTK